MQALVIISIIVLAGFVYFITRKPIVEAVAKQTVSQAMEKAEIALETPTQAIAENKAFAEANPTAASMMEQANLQIAAGQASAEDIARLEVDKVYYGKYVAAGGTASYGDFTSYTKYWNAEYIAAKQAVKDKATQASVAEIEASGTHYIQHMLTVLDPRNPVYQALAAKYPELVPTPVAAPTPTPTPIAAPTPSVAPVSDYAAAAVEATAIGGAVIWSSTGGYQAVSTEEAIRYGGPT